MKLIYTVALLTFVLSPFDVLAQPKQWACVRQPMVQTTDGDVVVLKCVAALPTNERLDADDEHMLNDLEIARHNFLTLKQLEQENPKNWSPDNPKGIEMKNGLRMGFGKTVGQLCQKHPSIALASLFPDETSATTKLYGCKTIVSASAKYKSLESSRSPMI